MVLNGKKGQQILVGLMVFFIVLAAVVQFIRPIKDQINTARNAENLNCGANNLTVGESGTCVIVDLALPYYIGIALAVAAGAIYVHERRKKDG